MIKNKNIDASLHIQRHDEMIRPTNSVLKYNEDQITETSLLKEKESRLPQKQTKISSNSEKTNPIKQIIDQNQAFET